LSTEKLFSNSGNTFQKNFGIKSKKFLSIRLVDKNIKVSGEKYIVKNYFPIREILFRRILELSQKSFCQFGW